jgi:plastocyanin
MRARGAASVSSAAIRHGARNGASGRGACIPRRAPIRYARVFASLMLLSSAVAAPVAAAQWYVQSGGANVAFAPQFLTIQAGDRVSFLNLGGYHNVVADAGAFRCAHGCDGDGIGGNGNASSDFWIASVTFPDAGTFGYFCEPHGAPGSGMYGAITVLAAPPPPVIVPAPGGGVRAGLLLGFALLLLALVELRRHRER